MANQSKVEKHARALCVELARTTDGQPMQWRMVAPIAAAVGLDDASAAIAYGGQARVASRGRPAAA